MSTRDWLFGGIGKSASDYAGQTQYNDRGQIQGLIQQGLGTANQAAPTVNAGQSDQFRAQQMQQANMLQRIASGQQQGAGELAVQRQVQNALAAQQAQARMARGGNAALAMRDSARQAGAVSLSGAGASQRAALEDQTAAQGLWQRALESGRGQDQQMALANLDAQLKTRGMNDEMRIAMLSQLTGMNANELAARMNAYGTGSQQAGIVGGLLNTGGQILGSVLSKPSIPSAPSK